MKKLFFLLTLFVNYSFSQTICDDAYEIQALPFYDLNVNTANADCDTSGNYCNSSGQSGNDTIFKFYSESEQDIDIIISNVQIQYDFLVNIFFLDTCPDAATFTNCINHVSGGTFEIINQHVNANKIYYIIISNTKLLSINSFIFDLEVRNHFNFDISIDEFNYPRSYYELTSFNGEVSAFITNRGNDTIDTLKFGIVLNGVEYFNSIINANLPPGITQKFYPFHLDFSTDGAYLTKLFLMNNDENPNNDTLLKRTHNLYEISTFPYFTDFESGSNGWVTEWKNGSNIQESWKLGTPQANIINSASSGNNAFVTNLTGNCNRNECSYLVSQSFNFSNITNPMIEFDLWKCLDSTASMYLEYTDTNENLWHRVGAINTGTNWYNTFLGQNDNTWLGNTNGWITARNKIEGAGGKPHVHVRFVFENYSSKTPEGIAIDNIRIYEAPNHDIGITNIISPISKCLIGEDSIKVTIFNFSPDSSHTNFIVNAIIDDIYQLSDTVLQIVQPNSSINYTFKNTFNFNTNKEYKIKAYTLLTNDDDTSNDADSINVFNFENYNTFPYKNDFETNNGVWFTYGINSSWEYGITTDSVINTASSGSNIWATNLNGYHNSPEESYLTSSCFNLSDLTKPLIKFNANFDLYLDDGVTSSYVQMEYSNDYGANWSILGNSTVNNWYTAGFSWTGKSQNWEQMYFNISDLIQFENTQFRFKLFALQAKTGFAFDDFEICNIPTSDFTYTVSSRNVITSNTSLLGETYKWFINDTLVSSEINPTLIVTEDTTQVTLIVYNSCFSDTLTKTIFTNGIYNLIANNVKIYPNPATTILTIEGKLTIETIEILDVTGKIVLTSSFREKEKKQFVNIRNLEKGIYFIKINNNSIVKFVKE